MSDSDIPENPHALAGGRSKKGAQTLRFPGERLISREAGEAL